MSLMQNSSLTSSVSLLEESSSTIQDKLRQQQPIKGQSLWSILGRNQKQSDSDAAKAPIDANNDISGLRGKRKYPTLQHLADDFSTASEIPSTASTSEEFPPTDKSDLEEVILNDCLSSNFIFGHLRESDIRVLIQRFEKVTYANHEVIIRSGDPPGFFYVVYSGDVEFIDDTGKTTTTSVTNEEIAEKYTVFGEFSLLTSQPQNVTVKAITACTLFRLDQLTFWRVVVLPPLKVHQTSTSEERMKLLRSAIPKDLIKYLQDDQVAMTKLLSGMTIHSFQKGDLLFEKGARIHSFVVISIGQVTISNISIGGRPYEDIHIGVGCDETSFGWLTMKEDEVLEGDVTARLDGQALVIPKDSFLAAVGGSSNCGKTTLQHIIDRRSARVELQNISIFQDSALDSIELNALLDVMHRYEYQNEEIVVDRAEKVDAAIRFVREGKLTIEIKNQDTQVIEAGGYIGEKSMLLDQNRDGKKEHVRRSPMKIVAHGDRTRVDVLYLKDCRKVVDTTRLGLRSATQNKEDASGESISKWVNVKKLAVLGSGSFGQVWLAKTIDPLVPPNVALKIQSKSRLVQSREHIERIVAERNIMSTLNSPFLIKLYASYQDKRHVFMVTSLQQGGELEALIPEYGMKESSAKFYAAGILEGLTHLHRKHIIHRDCKTANVLINANGFPVLIDFGFAKYVPDKTFTFCGSPMYTAPEIIRNIGHDKSCDYWSWAVLAYRMVTGSYPFYKKGMDELQLFKQICRGKFELDGSLSMEFRWLMVSLLYPNPKKRLGSTRNGWRDLFSSAWLSSIDVQMLHMQQLTPPWIPEFVDTTDVSRFQNNYFSNEDEMNDSSIISEEQQHVFSSFGPTLEID